jgi:hypothetical protein
VTLLQGERLAVRKMRVRWLQVADGLAASYSGYTTPESGTRARGEGEGSCANRRARGKGRML